MMRHLPLAILIAVSGVSAQGGSPIRYDFLELQETLHQAMDKVSPATVTVQTFGGTRKVEGGPWKHKPKTPPKPPDKKPTPLPVPQLISVHAPNQFVVQVLIVLLQGGHDEHEQCCWHQ